jgi:hypothetical protein
MKERQGFSTATAKFDQIHVRQSGAFAERDLQHEVVQCNHCTGSQFRAVRLASVEHHFGILCAFLMLSE